MSDRPSGKLIRTIEGEILPRLLVSAVESKTADGKKTAESSPVNELARVLLDRPDSGARVERSG